MGNPYATEAWLRKQSRARDAHIAALREALSDLLPLAQAYVDVTAMHTVAAIDKAKALLAAKPQGVDPC